MNSFLEEGFSSWKKIFLCVFLLLLPSCAAKRIQFSPDPSNPVYTIAVLPFYNATNSVEGPMMVRRELAKRLEGRHYSIMPLKEADEILRDRLGITLGSQLVLVNPEEVGAALGVDGLLYGYLLNFDDITTGVYNLKRVRAGFRFVEARSGTVIWAGGLGVKSLLAGGLAGGAITILKEIGDEVSSGVPGTEDIPGLKEWHVVRALATEKIEEAAILSLGESVLTRALGVHLALETDYLLDRVMKEFPAGPGSPRNVTPREEGP